MPAKFWTLLRAMGTENQWSFGPGWCKYFTNLLSWILFIIGADKTDQTSYYDAAPQEKTKKKTRHQTKDWVGIFWIRKVDPNQKRNYNMAHKNGKKLYWEGRLY